MQNKYLSSLFGNFIEKCSMHNNFQKGAQEEASSFLLEREQEGRFFYKESAHHWFKE